MKKKKESKQDKIIRLLEEITKKLDRQAWQYVYTTTYDPPPRKICSLCGQDITYKNCHLCAYTNTKAPAIGI